MILPAQTKSMKHLPLPKYVALKYPFTATAGPPVQSLTRMDTMVENFGFIFQNSINRSIQRNKVLSGASASRLSTADPKNASEARV